MKNLNQLFEKILNEGADPKSMKLTVRISLAPDADEKEIDRRAWKIIQGALNEEFLNDRDAGVTEIYIYDNWN